VSRSKITSASIEDSTIAAADIASGAVESAIATPLSHRNLIINGAMQVAQRGTSVTGSTANTYQTCDRWYHIASGATYNSSQESLTIGQTDIPRQFQYFLRFDETTGNNNSGIEQRVENILSIAGETVTLSFYAKGTNPGGGSMQIEFDEYWDGSAQTQNTESFTLTSSWQRFTFTRTLTDPTGKTIGSNSFLGIKFRQPTVDTNTNAWTLDITGVQLEVGSVATPFEHRSYGEELARCQRYFYGINQYTNSRGGTGWAFIATAVAYDTSHMTASLNLPVTLRTTPTISYSNLSGQFGFGRSGAVDYFDTLSGGNSDNNQNVNIYASNGLSHSIGDAGYFGIYFGSAYIHLDAEL